MRTKLPHGVIAKTNLSDPMDPQRLTLKQLREPAYRLWFKYIEPKIVVMGNAPEDCWCWDVDKRVHKIDNWYPQVWATLNPDKRRPVMQNMNARRFIAAMFWDYPKEYSIYRNKAICTQFNCVRPSHLIIAPHNNKEAKYG